MLGPKYRKKFSVINAGIVAEIIERYLSDPDSINESEYQLLLSTFKFESNGVNSNSGSISFDKRDRAYLYADLNPSAQVSIAPIWANRRSSGSRDCLLSLASKFTPPPFNPPAFKKTNIASVVS